MKERDRREQNPIRGIGAFLIAFGFLLATVMLDLFNIGDPEEYMMWQVLVLFIGAISLFKGKIISAVILFMVGTYFILPELNIEIPEFVETIFWPAAIVIAGIGFIISGIFKKANNQ